MVYDIDIYDIDMRGLGGVVGLTLSMARADRVRVPYTTYSEATLDKSLTSHCQTLRQASVRLLAVN